jgi:hypothetical protein
MRTTGGLASGATSTRSSPNWLASQRASSMSFSPICPPSGAMSRTLFTRIRSLTLGSAMGVPPDLWSSSSGGCLHEQRQRHMRCRYRTWRTSDGGQVGSRRLHLRLVPVMIARPAPITRWHVCAPTFRQGRKPRRLWAQSITRTVLSSISKTSSPIQMRNNHE